MKSFLLRFSALTTLISIAAISSAQTSGTTPKLDDIFGDHMVLQQGIPPVLRGTADPGQQLEIEINNQTKTVETDEQGRWKASFRPIVSNNPLEIKIDGTVAARDVLIGDVFLCTGQSNMEFPVRRALNPDREISGYHSSKIRLITIPKATSSSPEINFDSPEPWQMASADSVPEFSAVCYFTAQNLLQSIDSPIGLIDSTWGGTRIESWMSANSLRAIGERLEDLDLLDVYARNPKDGLQKFGSIWGNWWQSEHTSQPDIWAHPDAYSWDKLPGFTNWKTWGVPKLAEYDGQVWYRTSVALRDDQLQANKIELGTIDELDLVWINGQFIGSQFNWGGLRTYDIPEDVLRAGQNEIVVNVLSSWDKGGMFGPADALQLVGPDGLKVELNYWRYRKAATPGMNSPKAPWESVTGISGIGNAMIAPLSNIGLKGVLWYQGESNADGNAPYEKLLKGLIQDWQTIVSPDVKALIFQLPEFGQPADKPGESGWAVIREAQRQVTEAAPAAGLVVTLGAGDRYDIHPSNKQEVARRAADVANSLFYDLDIPDTNRRPVTAVTSGQTVTISLSDSGRGLKTWASNSVIGMELCDAANCSFVDARTEGANVILNIPKGLIVERARYNWADTPWGNLADESGRPVGPFEVQVGTNNK